MVESSVSLSTGGNANRISGWDVLGISSSAYELETSDSQSNRKEENADRIFPVTEQEVMEKTFYTDRKSTRLNSSHRSQSRMPSSA